MSHLYDDAEAERRQQERRDLIARCGNPPVRERQPRPRSEQDERLAAGLIFSIRDDQVAELMAERKARRRRADAEVAERDHLWNALRDSEGSDYADQWFGGDAA